MLFPGYIEYGSAWTMIAAMVSWIALITLTVVLFIRAFPQIERDETA